MLDIVCPPPPNTSRQSNLILVPLQVLQQTWEWLPTASETFSVPGKGYHAWEIHPRGSVWAQTEVIADRKKRSFKSRGLAEVKVLYYMTNTDCYHSFLEGGCSGRWRTNFWAAAPYVPAHSLLHTLSLHCCLQHWIYPGTMKNPASSQLPCCTSGETEPRRAKPTHPRLAKKTEAGPRSSLCPFPLL